MLTLENNLKKILLTDKDIVIKKEEFHKELDLEFSNSNNIMIIDKIPEIFLGSHMEMSLERRYSKKNKTEDCQKIFFELFLQCLKNKKINNDSIKKWFYTIEMYYYDSGLDFLKEVENKFKIATEIENIGYSGWGKDFLDIVFKNVKARNINKSEEDINNILLPLKNSNELLFKYMIAPLSVDNFRNTEKNLYQIFYHDYDNYLISGILDNKIKLKNGFFTNGLINNYTNILKKCVIEDESNLTKTSHLISSIHYLNIDILNLIEYTNEVSKEKAKNLVLKITKNKFKFNKNNKMDLIGGWLYAKENNLLYNENEIKRKKDIKKELYNECDSNTKTLVNFCLDGIRNNETADVILIIFIDSMDNSIRENIYLYQKLEKNIKKLVNYLNKNAIEKEIFYSRLDNYQKKLNENNYINKEKDKIELLISLVDKHELLINCVENNKLKSRKIKF